MQRLLPQNLFHGFALGQFVHQFVQIPDFLHQWVLNGFHFDAADTALDQVAIFVQAGGILEKVAVGKVTFQKMVQVGSGIPGKPGGNFVYFRSGTAFSFCFGNQ